jgi:hypothetical protein
LDIDSNSDGCTSTAGGCPACCALTGAEKHRERCQDEGKVPRPHTTLQPNDAKGFFEPPHRKLGGLFIPSRDLCIARIFFITAGTFAAMSLYGYATQRDLSQFGSFLFMGLIGIVLASLVNIFIGSRVVREKALRRPPFPRWQ